MDISIERYLEEAAGGGAPVKVVAALATTHPVVTPFLVAPLVAECHQGIHHSRVIVLAQRGDTVLYADSETHQFGIAFKSEARLNRLVAGREYPSIDLAILMFVGDRAALDPD
jgi:hypothetical protein